VIANGYRGKNEPVFDMYHFHPYAKRPKKKPTAAELEAIFSGGGKHVVK